MEINDELVEQILRQYDAFMESGIGDDIKADGEKKLFVQGYLCNAMQQENMRQTDDAMIRNQIIQTRSKYCEPVLELLAIEGELYHGDLAEKMNLSPSGLNAIIKKMQETEIPIINTTQIGKYKIYSLPDNVRDFMLKKNGGQISDEPEEKEVPKAVQKMSYAAGKPDIFLCLQHFAEKAGRDWKDSLNLLFRGIEEGISTEVKAEFTAFSEALADTYEEEPESMEDLKRLFHNEVLSFLMEDYLKNYDLRKELMRLKNAGKLTSGDKRFLRSIL